MSVRHPSGLPGHPSQQQFGPGPGPSTLMRRSISPVPLSNGVNALVPTTLGGGPVPPSFVGPKSNGWSGPPSGKESKRINGDVDPRDRERMSDVMSQRERAEREREREDRAYHLAHTQSRHPAHQHPHQHVHGGAQAQAGHHHGSHTHQHHHHHIHHHHHAHPGAPLGPPMSGLHNSNGGPAPHTLSPPGARDFEPRRARSGAPTEVIELSAPPNKPPITSPQMSAFWKGSSEDMYPPTAGETQRHRERDRDRERVDDGKVLGPLGPPQAGAHERLMTPFTMGPSQALQASPHGTTPRKPPGPNNVGTSNPLSSRPASRRGSWSAEDPDLPRPSSSSHGLAHTMVSPPGQRPPSTRIPQPVPPSSSFYGPFGSPPHNNGRALPPTSPSGPAFAGPHRSPTRPPVSGRLPLGGPLSPPPSHPLSPRIVGSPGSRVSRPRSPGMAKAAPVKLGGFPIPESGNIAPIATSSSGPLPSRDLVAPPALHPILPPVPRLTGTSLGDKVPPTTKVVPVDGP